MTDHRTFASLAAGFALSAFGLVADAQTGADDALPSTAAASATPSAAAKPDLLGVLGYAVTAGAAPGYVEDRACAICHGELWSSYQEVAMARSLYRPRPENAVEALGEVFEHAPSQQRFSMRFEDERLIFRRDQRAQGGAPINVFEHEVAWILGSGNHARVYLIRQPSGELIQLPVSWYAADASGAPARWGMAPGFDGAEHHGVGRRVRRECMFCHNAYPDVPAGADAAEAPQIFPTELPAGIGCQRCHGPGADHARLAFGGVRDRDAVRDTIVNPGRLAPERRDDICFGCHLQPSVAMPGVRRLGRGDYSFRPGEDLAAYLVQVDIDEDGRARDERFEINHHPYRLRQSRCFVASKGTLSCLTCHDPHRKVPAASRAAHFRAACQGCHAADACSRPEHLAEAAGGAVTTDSGDCVACHMPRRRPSDVVQVVMTDHRISRRFDAEAYLAPRAERDPVITDIGFYWPERAPPGALGEMYRALAVLRVAATDSALDHLLRQLSAGAAKNADGSLVAWRDLGRAALTLGRGRTALYALDRVLAAQPQDAEARMWQGLAQLDVSHQDAAMTTLEQAAQTPQASAEAWYNVGRVALAQDRLEVARDALGQATALRPTFAQAWLILGRARARAGDTAGAITAWRQALAVDPRLAAGYDLLADGLDDAGQGEEAERYRRLAETLGVSPAAASDLD